MLEFDGGGLSRFGGVRYCLLHHNIIHRFLDGGGLGRRHYGGKVVFLVGMSAAESGRVGGRGRGREGEEEEDYAKSGGRHVVLLYLF